MPTDKYHLGISKDVETGALVHAPSATELAGWRVRRTLLGVALLAVGVSGLFLGLMGLSEDPEAGGGAALTSILTLGASVAIAFFGVRYLQLGLKGKGVRLYERAVEADFFSSYGVMPHRRTVPLLRMHISGSARLAYGQAITTTGHAFRLPPSLVERSDLWYLGSLGTKPLAPGGRVAKEAFERGDLAPYEREPPDDIVDHGPPWPRTPRAGDAEDDVVVSVAEAVPEAPPVEVPRAPGPVPRTAHAPPGPLPPSEAAPRSARPPVRPRRVVVPQAPPQSLPDEPVEAGAMDLPDAPGPGRPMPPPPRFESPLRRPPMAPSGEGTAPRAPEPPGEEGPSVVPEAAAPPPAAADGWELEEVPPPDVAPPTPAPPGPAPAASDEWELEEVPPPEGGDGGHSGPPSRSEWEEL